MTTYGKIKNRQEFEAYCMRKLGSPVINIEIAQEQIDDRIDDALQLFFERHNEAVQEHYLVYKLTAVDKENGYITLPPEVLDVLEIFLPNNNNFSIDSLDDPTFQMMQYINGFGTIGVNIGSQDNPMTYYTIVMQNYADMKRVFIPINQFRYSKSSCRIEVDTALLRKYEYFCIRCYICDTVETLPEMWNNDFLKKYATCLLKIQWGENITKYGNIPAPSGLTLDFSRILDDAQKEKEELERQFSLKYEDPPLFFVG